MPEYVCVVANSHRRLYGLPQIPAPHCCGKPMVMTPGGPQPEALVQPEPAAAGQVSRQPATVPQQERNWWQLWK